MIFVIKVKNEEESDIVQRIAFSFGYTWFNNKTGVMNRESNCIIFDSNWKIMRWTSVIMEKEVVVSLSDGYKAIVDQFKKADETFVEFEGGVKIFSNGDVEFGNVVYKEDYIDRFIEARNTYLGK